MNSHIKDSANNYTLYVDQGSTFTMDVLNSVFGVTDSTNLTFVGTVKRHNTSKKFVDFTITKLTDRITIMLTSEGTSTLSDRYSFDVIYKNELNVVTKAFGGSLICTNTVSSI